jgi:sarcosine oxidase
MRRALSTIMPRVRFDDCITKRCILTRTASHGNPYIGQIDDQLYVAIGNGWSAMCSDAIGRVAAHLMREGEFPEGCRSVDFEPVFAE